MTFVWVLAGKFYKCYGIVGVCCVQTRKTEERRLTCHFDTCAYTHINMCHPSCFTHKISFILALYIVIKIKELSGPFIFFQEFLGAIKIRRTELTEELKMLRDFGKIIHRIFHFFLFKNKGRLILNKMFFRLVQSFFQTPRYQ